jgi:hypothetical protein
MLNELKVLQPHTYTIYHQQRTHPMRPLPSVNISAGWNRDGLIDITLEGKTDEIAITFRLTTEEAQKLIALLQDRVKGPQNT